MGSLRSVGGLGLLLVLLGCPTGTHDDDVAGDDDTSGDDDASGDDDVSGDDDATADDDDTADCSDHCANAIRDCGETAVDCGGECSPCPEEELSADGGLFPSIAATAAAVIAVWGDANQSHQLFYACHDGASWTAAQAVPGMGANSDFGRLQTDGQGRIHLVVHAGMGDNRSAMYAVIDASAGCGGTWSDPVQVDDGTDNSCWPQIAVDEDDDPHICWTDRDYYEIQCASSSGGSWGAPETVVASGVQSCHSDVAASGSTLHVVWQEGDAPRLPAYSHSTGGGGYTEPFELSDQFHNWPQIVTDASGNLHALYTYRHSDHDVKYRKMSGGVWGAEQVVSTPPSEWTWPSLAIDAGGGLHAVWHQTDDVEHIYYDIGDAATEQWQTARQVSTDGDLNNRDACLAIDPSGRAHVIWIHKENHEDADTPGSVRYRVATWDDLAP